MQSQNTEDGNEGRGSIAKYLTKKPQLRTESKPCEGCQSGIWSGCNEIWVDWIQLYPYVKLIGQIAGEGNLISACCLPAQVL
jgi:hypothetical protein